MQIVRPITMTDAVMTYTNVPEDDAAEWSGATTYATGERVIKASTHRVYESLTDSNTDDPEAGVTANPATWLDVGATQPWRIYDEKVRNVTAALEPYDASVYHAYNDAATANGIAIEITPGVLADGLALLNISGIFAHVTVETAEGVVYRRRVALSGGLESSSWHAYFFTPIDRQTQLILTDLPASLDAVVRVAIEESSAPAQIGELIIGRAIKIGETKWGPTISIIDYSKKERDEFGNLVVTKRRYTQLAEFPVQIERRSADVAYSVLAGIRAQPTLFIGTPLHATLAVYGVYRDMRITFDNYAFCEATIEVEEV